MDGGKSQSADKMLTDFLLQAEAELRRTNRQKYRPPKLLNAISVVRRRLGAKKISLFIGYLFIYFLNNFFFFLFLSRNNNNNSFLNLFWRQNEI